MTALDSPVVILERTGRVAPLGLRFWDTAAGAWSGSGLIVRAWRRERPDVSATATVSSAGIYGFARLPGLGFVQSFGMGDDAYWASVNALTWTIDVRDPLGRYLPITFDALAPSRGLFSDLCPASPPIASPPIASPPAASPPALPPAGVPLFPAPARPIPAGMGVLRFELSGAGADRPAAWALLRVTLPGGASISTLADARGCALALFPWPTPERTLPASPPASPPVGSALPLWEQAWTLGVSVAWSPPVAQEPVPQPSTGVDLCAALAQANAALHTLASPPLPLTTVDVRYGVETTVRAQVV